MPRGTRRGKGRKRRAFISSACHFESSSVTFLIVWRCASNRDIGPPVTHLGHPLDYSTRRGKGPGDLSGAARRGSAKRASERASEAFRKPVITDPAYIKRCRRQSPAAGRGLRVFHLSFYIRFFSPPFSYLALALLHHLCSLPPPRAVLL